jgi:hypothetical protein
MLAPKLLTVQSGLKSHHRAPGEQPTTSSLGDSARLGPQPATRRIRSDADVRSYDIEMIDASRSSIGQTPSA